MATKQESKKQAEEILRRVAHFFIHNKESSTGMVILSGMSISTIETAIRKLYLSGRLVRRLVCLSEGSSREVWAYRIADQEPSLITFAPEPRRSKGPSKPRNRDRSKEHSSRSAISHDAWTMDQEPEHYKLLRTLPLPPFEGYPELEAA
jgi:hypothetical protein